MENESPTIIILFSVMLGMAGIAPQEHMTAVCAGLAEIIGGEATHVRKSLDLLQRSSSPAFNMATFNQMMVDAKVAFE